MSVARLQLDRLLAAQGPWLANERGAYVLTVGNDVIVNIVEDESAEEMHMFSAAGYQRAAHAVAVELPRDALGEGRFGARVAAHSGLVLALRTLQRAQVDAVAFRQELAGHVQAVRALACVLPCGEAGLLDRRAPECVRWLRCAVDAGQGDRSRVRLPARELGDGRRNAASQ